MSWQFEYHRCHNLDGLKRYVEEGIPVGGFLSAVISNDLREACGRADDYNLRVIPIYVAWLYNEAPGGCWGSKENMDAWIERHAKARAERKVNA